MYSVYTAAASIGESGGEPTPQVSEEVLLSQWRKCFRYYLY